MATSFHRGSCLCGGVVYEVHGPLRDVIACHCTQCRKQTGHYMAATGASPDDFRLRRGRTVALVSLVAERPSVASAARCGSVLFWRAEASYRTFRSRPARSTDPTGVVTEGHIFCADKGDYYVIPDEGYRREQWE